MKNLTLLFNCILIIALSAFFQIANAQAPSIAWQKTFGGSDDDYGANMVKTSDGNYVVFGLTNSTDGDFSYNRGDFDAFAIKYDAQGNKIWSKTYGGSAYDDFSNVLQTKDGGFLAVGVTTSNDGDVHGNHGGQDIWVSKLNADGDLLWSKCFGGSGDDLNYQSSSGIIQTCDGNYMFAAITNSTDGDVAVNKGGTDGWIVKFNKLGKIIFSETYGGSQDDVLQGVVETSAGKYVICGGTYSTDGDVIGNHGGQDYMVMKIGKNGKIKWSRCYGGSIDDVFDDAVHGNGSTVVLGGETNSNDGDVTGYNGGDADSWILKIKAQTGDIVWEKCFGTTLTEACFGLIKTTDGYVSVGAQDSSGYCCFETWDALAIKMDEDGNQLWSKVLGGTDYDQINTGVATDEGGVMLNCVTTSNDGDVTGNHGGPEDGWLVKLNADGERVSSSDISSSTGDLKNYPNPFSTSTTISFSLAHSQNVSLKIYDVTGRLISIIANEIMNEGNHQLQWNATDNYSGMYFLKMEMANESETIRLSVVK